MADIPRSLIELQHRFPDEAACAAYLTAARWPQSMATGVRLSGARRQPWLGLGNQGLDP